MLLSACNRLDDLDGVAFLNHLGFVFATPHDACITGNRNSRLRRTNVGEQLCYRQPVGEFARFTIYESLHGATVFATRRETALAVHGESKIPLR